MYRCFCFVSQKALTLFEGKTHLLKVPVMRIICIYRYYICI